MPVRSLDPKIPFSPPQADFGSFKTSCLFPTLWSCANSAPFSPAPCRPCSDTEVLLAVCTSDFVIRGSIQDVTNEAEEQESIIHVGVNKLYRQKSKVFQLTGESGNWRGQIKTLLECGVRPGDGDFLFTGRMHFGEARLGCAPRFKDFQRMYKEAKDKGLNPCEIGPD